MDNSLSLVLMRRISLSRLRISCGNRRRRCLISHCGTLPPTSLEHLSTAKEPLRAFSRGFPTGLSPPGGIPHGAGISTSTRVQETRVGPEFPCRMDGEAAQNRGLLVFISKCRNGWCRGPESNWGHRPFQGRALPAELPRHCAGTTGFEPAISGVTIQRLRPDWTTSPCSGSPFGQDRTRTCDLPDVSRMLSQLSYSPIIAAAYASARPRLRPQGDLNPCRRDENPVSWAAR